MRLQGKRVLITGGSSGIGRAIALGFAREGADVAFTYRHRAEAADRVVEAVRADGRVAFAGAVDLADTSALPAIFDEARSALGGLDVLVNNAAEITRTAFVDLTEEELDRVMRTNFKAPFVLTQLFCRDRLNAGSAGAVVNVSSVSASSAISRMAHYQSSKAALSMLTRSVAYEMAPHGVRVNTISPGLTATGANQSQWRDDPNFWASRAEPIPIGRAGVPEDHVGAAIFLASDESSWMTGADLVIDGGQSTI